MVKDVQVKKRKASAAADEVVNIKKTKKVTTEVAQPEKKRKATEEASPVTSKKSKTPKAKDADEETPKPKSTKKAPKIVETETVEVIAAKAPKKAKDSAAKKLKTKITTEKTREPAQIDTPVVEDEPAQEDVGSTESVDGPEAEPESEDDDQTEAFLKGFASDEEEEVADAAPVSEIPKLDKKQKKLAKKAAEDAANDLPGVLYIGRIPHGFYEYEMREYFKQFGDIKALRLARNRKTGASKHIAWIQFESAAVANIVAKTMDNYLLFGHILKVKVVPDEQVPENLFKGANKRFKKVPWNKIAGRKLAQGASESTWSKRIEKEEKRRADRNEKLKSIGYEFEGPQLKSAVAKRKEQLAIAATSEEGKEEEQKAIEEPSAAEEPVAAEPAPKSKKEKKAKKSKDVAVAEVPTEVPVVSEIVETEVIVTEEPVKTLKKKKSKTNIVEAPAEATNGKAKKTKKAKKVKSQTF